MINRICGGKQNDTINIEGIKARYMSYSHGKQGSQYNIFYTFLLNELQIIQPSLYSHGLKECLLNEKGVFFKKSDIFRSVCTDKLFQIINLNENIYCQTEQDIFLGGENFHKPDISIFCDITEEGFEDFIDSNLVNPKPDVLIEIVDTNDIEYLYELIRVYKRSIKLFNNILVLFIDPIKKDLYMFRNDIQIALNESEQLFYLQKINFYDDLQYKSLIFNFEKMLMKK